MLSTSKTTLILGASPKPYRYSFLVAQRLIENKIPIRLLAKRKGEVLGHEINIGKPTFKDIDTITIYLSDNNQQEYFDYILKLKPRRVIFNPGAENEVLEKLLVANDIAVENACTLVMLSIGQY